jgi:hypothetical protein
MLPLASPPFRFPVQGQLELGQVLELLFPFSLTVEFQKLPPISEYIGKDPPHIRMCNRRMFAMEILDPTKGDGMWLLSGVEVNDDSEVDDRVACRLPPPIYPGRKRRSAWKSEE